MVKKFVKNNNNENEENEKENGENEEIEKENEEIKEENEEIKEEKGKSKKKRGRKKHFWCEICGKHYQQKKGFNAHKCFKTRETKIYCRFCETDRNYKNFYKHQEFCFKKKFFALFGAFLNFLFRLIKKYNNSIYYNYYLGFDSDIKNIVLQKKLNGTNDENEKKKIIKEFQNDENKFIKDNYDLLNEVKNDIKNEEKNKLKNLSEDININDENEIKKLRKIDGILERQHVPYISFRKIVINFFNSRYPPNNLVINKLNKKYKKNDFYTNEEIMKINEEKAIKIFQAMYDSREYQAKIIFFTNKLIKFADGESVNECIYCEKIIIHKYKHFLKCKKMKKLFKDKENEGKKYEFFNQFLNYYFKNKNYNFKKLNNNFKNENFEYFVKNIRKYIENEEKFEENKRKEENKKIYKFKNDIDNKIRIIRRNRFTEIINKIILILEIKHCCKINSDEKNFLNKQLINQIKNDEIINKEKIINNFLKEYNINEDENLKKIMDEHDEKIRKKNEENNEDNNENNNEEDDEENEDNEENEENEDNNEENEDGENDEENKNDILVEKTICLEDIDKNEKNKKENIINFQRNIEQLKKDLNYEKYVREMLKKTQEKIKKPPVKINYIIKKK